MLFIFLELLWIGAPGCLLAGASRIPLAAQEPVLPEFSADALLKHVQFLAGEELEGRRAGTPGERRAAEYAARELEKSGVMPFPPARRFQPFDLPAAAGQAPLTSRNVLGWIPGSGTGLEDQVIVLGAHLDHLGITPDGLHPGADDNASGAAVLLEIAARLQSNASALRRPVLVVFFGSEELDLLGSTRFLSEGPLDPQRLAAMVNIDMIGRPLADQEALAPLKRLFKIDSRNSIGVMGASSRPFFAEIVDAACAEAKLEPFGTKNLPLLSSLIENLARNRGDHAPFERAGIPAIFFGSGESDDYHRPTDTVLKLEPELMARRARAIYGAVLALSRAPAGKIPPRQNVQIPAGEKVRELELKKGELELHLLDNAGSPKVLSGAKSLFNLTAAPGFCAFDPDAPGAAAGLNFEHIISGHKSPFNSFAPRHGRYDLYRLEDGRSGVLVRRREDCPWEVSSTLRYALAEPHALDLEFRCTPHSRAAFGGRGYAIFFFADYMNDVEDAALHFLGVDAPGGAEKWIAADAPPGRPDWNQGGTYRHVDAGALECDPDHNFRLNSWSYDWPRFTRPFYYGRAARGMVFIIMFDRAHTVEDEVRFSLFKFKLPVKPRPAWDFQYAIHRVEENREYGFKARAIWKKWVSPEDCLAEYESWAKNQK